MAARNLDWLDQIWSGDADPSHISRRQGKFATNEFRSLIEAFDVADGKEQPYIDRSIVHAYDQRGLPLGVRSRVNTAWRDEDDPTLVLTGEFVGPKFEMVGQWHRSIMRRPDGSLVAIHAEMEMLPEWRGNGIGSIFNENAEAWYTKAGISEIALYANDQVGGYAWARAGYDWDPEATFRGEPEGFNHNDALLSTEINGGYGNVPSRMDDAIVALESGNHGGVSPEVVEAVLSELREARQALEEGYLTPYMVSEIGRDHTWTDDIDGQKIPMWLGKDIMLGSKWSGIRRLEARHRTRTV